MPLDAPYPWFGGKAAIVGEVWRRFGDVTNFVEPFFGGGAVLFSRPEPFDGVETINDADAYVENFWRAAKAEPEKLVDSGLDWPVNEAALEARHKWLVTAARKREHYERMRDEHDYYDLRIAAYWCWGLCAWIGTGWCAGEWHGRNDASHGMGTHGGDCAKRPHLGDAGLGVHRQVPHLSGAGMGVHRQRPHLSDAGVGVHRKRPHLSDAGVGECERRRANLVAWMQALSDRLRNTRVCCGDWLRVCGSEATTTGHGITGVFLDPPYAHDLARVAAWRTALRTGEPFTEPAAREANRAADIYSNDGTQDVDRLVVEVSEWAIEAAKHPDMRIALCGYDGEHDMPGWDTWSWKARGGYANLSADDDTAGKRNAHREVIWFSPGCRREALLWE